MASKKRISYDPSNEYFLFKVTYRAWTVERDEEDESVTFTYLGPKVNRTVIADSEFAAAQRVREYFRENDALEIEIESIDDSVYINIL